MSGTITMTGEEYDALHAEAEALRVALLEIASVNPAQRGIEWAKSYASDGLKGAGSELCARWLDTFKEAEALRADSQHWKKMHAGSMAMHISVEFERDELRTELEEARGLLREAREAYAEAIHWEDQQPVMKKIDAFLTATTSPDVPDHIAEASRMAEQGERQEAAAEYQQLSRYGNWDRVDKAVYDLGKLGDTPEKFRALYSTPQPSQDVRALVEAINFACKSLCHVTSSDGSGHADIALSVLRMAGVDGEERERLVDGWKASCQWRIDKAHRQAQSQA